MLCDFRRAELLLTVSAKYLPQDICLLFMGDQSIALSFRKFFSRISVGRFVAYKFSF